MFEKIFRKPLKDQALRIFMCNVGQGDHLFFKVPGGGYGILDSHYDTTNLNQSEPPILIYFRYIAFLIGSEIREKYPEWDENMLQKKIIQKIREEIQIEFLCISHTDRDHIKGFVELIEWLNYYKIPIKHFWIPGILQKEHFDILFTECMNKIEESNRDIIFNNEQKRTLVKIKSYLHKTTKVFEQIKNWKHNTNPEIGPREQNLTGYKFIGGLGEKASIKVRCIGPLDSHLNTLKKISYINHIKNILGDIYINNEAEFLKEEEERMQELDSEEKDKWKKIKEDKNIMSHLLWFHFHTKHLIFAGDTHGYIIQDCIKDYKEHVMPGEGHGHKNTFVGNTEFVKVAHHGSANSSSPDIWNQLLSIKKQSFLGVSAGKHGGYQHPNSAFFEDLENCNTTKYVTFSTNICTACLQKDVDTSKNTSSVHPWHTNFEKLSKKNVKKRKNKKYDVALAMTMTAEEYGEINELISQANEYNASNKTHSLFAYEFVFHKTRKSIIKHLLPSNKIEHCFFKNRKSPYILRNECT